MPLQRDMCEGGQIVPMLLDMPTLRRNKFLDPRFKGTGRVNFQSGALHEHLKLNSAVGWPNKTKNS